MNVARGAGKQIIEDYVETGKIRYVFRHFPFISDQSFRAAEAADCADAQGRFLDWHAKLADEWEKSGAFIEDDNLKSYTQELGLDTAAFNACYDERTYEGSVIAEKEGGKELGVQTTPTMFIGDEFVLEGEKTFDQSQAAIEQALANAQ
jgi:protein-disulfide isomerase